MIISQGNNSLSKGFHPYLTKVCVGLRRRQVFGLYSMVQVYGIWYALYGKCLDTTSVAL